MDHYIGLFSAYAVIATIRYGLLKSVPNLIPVPGPLEIEKPGRELFFLFLTVLAVIVIGQFYSAGMLIASSGSLAGILEAINQILIFSPIFVFLWFVKPSAVSIYLVPELLAKRLFLGVFLAGLALLVFVLATPADLTLLQLLSPMWKLENLDFPVQVFFEDLFIAMCLARLSCLVSVKRTIVIVAVVFAAAHIPAFLAAGDTPVELLSLVADTALGIMVFGTVLMTRDFIWVWPVHVVMDFTQLAF